MYVKKKPFKRNKETLINGQYVNVSLDDLCHIENITMSHEAKKVETVKGFCFQWNFHLSTNSFIP